MKTRISEQDFVTASARGKQALGEAYAVSARFSRRSHMLTIAFSNGFECSIDVRKAPVLCVHLEADLAAPRVTPGGDGLIFDQAGVEVGLPALVAAFLPPGIMRAARAVQNGKISSPLKASAARRNGALGGRPRKSIAGRVHMPQDVDKLPTTKVDQFVEQFASAHGIVYERTGLDDWAEAVTRAAGDDVRLDKTGKLLVALRKQDLINGRQLARLMTNHMRERKRVRPVRGLRDRGLSAKR